MVSKIQRRGLGDGSYSTLVEARAATADKGAMTPLRAMQQLRTVVEVVNPREPRFAGGAIVDGTTDCRAAVQAAIDYAKSLGTYFYGGSIQVRLPAGVLRFTTKHPTKTDRILDLTGCNNVEIVGQGEGATTLDFRGVEAALFRNDETKLAPLSHGSLREFTIRGSYQALTAPAAFLGSAGIILSAANGFIIEKVRIYSCATGLGWFDCFNCEFIHVRIPGLGDLACRDGMYAYDGDPTLTENAVGIYGGRIYGCTRIGFRGECITGTLIIGLEVLGCTAAAMDLGNSPGGKELKWVNVRDVVLDSSGQLLKVYKGASTVAELIHFSGMWLGYASAAVGIGVDFNGIVDSSFNAEVIANTQFAANFTNCDRISFRAGNIRDYDRNLSGGVAVVCNNTPRSRFDIGTTKKLAGSPSTTAFSEQGTSNRNLITGVFDGAVATVGAQTVKSQTIVY